MVLSLPRVEPEEGESLEYYYKGICVSRGIPKDVFEELEAFEVRKDDVYLITYPKAGDITHPVFVKLFIFIRVISMAKTKSTNNYNTHSLKYYFKQATLK